MKLKSKGFTLLELLIVIGIIAVLASAVVVAINPAKQFQQARDATRNKQISSIYEGIISRKMYNNSGIWDCSTTLPNDRYREIQGPGMTDIYSCIYPDYLSSAIVDPKEGVEMSGKNIKEGLIGHWSFDKGYGDTAYDLSGSENDGTFESGSKWIKGIHGGALDLDESIGTNFIKPIDIGLDLNNETISFWMNAETLRSNVGGGGFSNWLVHWGDYYSNNSGGFGLQSGNVRYYIKGSTSSGWSASGSVGSNVDQLYDEEDWLKYTVVFRGNDAISGTVFIDFDNTLIHCEHQVLIICNFLNLFLNCYLIYKYHLFQ